MQLFDLENAASIWKWKGVHRTKSSVCDIEFGVSISIDKIIIQYRFFCPKNEFEPAFSLLQFFACNTCPFVLDLCIPFYTCDFQPYCSIISGVCLCCRLSAGIDLMPFNMAYVFFLLFCSLLIPAFLSSLYSFLSVPFRSDLIHCSYSLGFQS